MICYKDKTFCTDSSYCKNSIGCYRNLSKDEEQRAIKLGLPMAISSFKSTCKDWKEKK